MKRIIILVSVLLTSLVSAAWAQKKQPRAQRWSKCIANRSTDPSLAEHPLHRRVHEIRKTPGTRNRPKSENGSKYQGGLQARRKDPEST